jgi:hypothetical protein
MRFNPYLFRSLLTCVIAIALSSCSSTDCPLNNIVQCHYTFYSSTSKQAVSYTDTLTVIAADSIILNKLVNSQSFSLPMSYIMEEDTLIFLFKSSEKTDNNQVIVSHTNTPHFVSLECGTSYFHQIMNISFQSNTPSSVIDSIVVSNRDVNYGQNENIRIYLSNY